MVTSIVPASGEAFTMRTNDRVLLPQEASTNSMEPTNKTVKTFLTNHTSEGFSLRISYTYFRIRQAV